MKFRVVSGAALELICGNIIHWSQLNKPSKVLAWTVIKSIYDNIRNHNIKKTCFYILPLSLLREFKFWYIFSDMIKILPLQQVFNFPSLKIYGSSDASQSAGGFIIANVWSYYNFKKAHKHWHINQKELHVVLTALYTLRKQITGKTLHIFIDNKVAVYALKKKWSKKYNIMFFVYELCILMLKFKFLVQISWISSHNNIL